MRIIDALSSLLAIEILEHSSGRKDIPYQPTFNKTSKQSEENDISKAEEKRLRKLAKRVKS